MTDLQAAALGFIQGATEWLPISSTAHLRFIPALLRWGDPGAAFTAIIQWGTVLAALVYFWRDIAHIVGTSYSDSGADRRLLLPIIVGTVPIVVLGIVLRHQIENQWRSLYVVAGSMIGFGVLLAIAEARHRSRREMGSVAIADGLAVGIGQAFALIPGASRSGTTITAALLLGLERSTAARFSFLLSLPAVFGAGLWELWSKRHAIASAQEIRPIVIATLVAFLVGIASIHWLIGFLRKHTTYGFVAYRVVVGAAILAIVAAQLVPADEPAEGTARPPRAAALRTAPGGPASAPPPSVCVRLRGVVRGS